MRTSTNIAPAGRVSICFRTMAVLAVGIGSAVNTSAQQLPSEGRLLLDWCSAVQPNPARSEAEAIGRVACLQTIKATVSLQRAQNQIALEWNSLAGTVVPGTSGPRMARGLPGPFCLMFRDDVYTVTDAIFDARGLVRYLHRQPPEALDSQGTSDDVTMRLLLGYLAETYPCAAGSVKVFDRDARRPWK